ncbi:MAG: 4-amino-4-deoxy-L-arabinose-phosphoundecaprenol flippase subunit ArnF [Synergistetes bacterium ADurb.Bin520]|jgi:multidrug transporter EmrE-like cation transporter|nr:MAG: 4-amino-4-deoxy-L-arabinose-phosphoundecaprenol flippase subunit ArnF [Synergistetes bacterium ADurb.Bin520]
MDAVLVFLLAGDIIANAGAHVLLKQGAQRPRSQASGLRGMVENILFNPCSLVGMGAYVLSFVFYAALLTRMDLSIAYPLCTSLSFLMVLLASVLWFREHLDGVRLGGIGAILLGILVISIGG